MEQLRILLDDQIIKERHPDRKTKLKTVTKQVYLTGIRWCLALDSDSLIAHKISSKTCFGSLCQIFSHSMVYSKNDSYFVGIKPLLK